MLAAGHTQQPDFPEIDFLDVNINIDIANSFCFLSHNSRHGATAASALPELLLLRPAHIHCL